MTWTKITSGTSGGNTYNDTYTITVQQAGTATPWNYYNALDNGFKNDGTTDNATAFNSLVSAVSGNGGGIIYAPKGTYMINSTVTWKSNVHLIGDGKELTVFKGSGTAQYAIFGYVRGVTIDNFSFRDFTVDCYGIDNSASYSTSQKAFYFQNCTNGIFRDLLLKGTNATALGTDFLHDVVIDNVTCIDCGRNWSAGKGGGAGIGIGTGTQTIENLQIVNCKTYNCGQFGIFLEHQGLFSQGTQLAKGVIIANNIIKGGKNYGLGVKGGHNVTVVNNQVYENTNHGIYLYGGSTSTNTDLGKVTIASNTFSENGGDGINLDNNSVVSNLLISKNMTTGNTGAGIRVPSGTSGTYDKIFIEDNIVTGNGSDLYVGSSNITNLRIKGNEMINNTVSNGKISFSVPTAYAKFPTELLDFPYNQITLQVKLPSVTSGTKCILSRRDTTYTGTGKAPKGFSINIVAGNVLQITGYTTNDGTKYTYQYTDVLTAGTVYYIKINTTSTTLTVQYSTDGVNYTTPTLDTVNSTGTDANIISILSTNIGLPIYMAREWTNAWANYFQGLIVYQFNVTINDSASGGGSFYYLFNNVGKNNEIYDYSGSRLHAKASLGAQQLANGQ